MFNLAPEDLQLVRKILKRNVPDCEVRVFGSRVSGPVKPYSDLDLALVGKGRLEFSRLSQLKEDFQISDLPIRVDVLDWHAISDNFKKIIESRYEVLQKPRRRRGSPKAARRLRKKSNA